MGFLLLPTSALATEAPESTLVQPVVQSLPWLGETCAQGRLPTLSGGWAIGCGTAETPQRAIQLMTQARSEFSPPAGAWGISHGILLDLHSKSFFLPGEEQQRLTPVSSPIHAPLISDGESLLLSGPNGLEHMALGGNERQTIPDSNPAPWYSPAINDHGMFWVELQNGKEELWWTPHETAHPKRFIPSDKAMRHVVAEGDFVGWMSDDAVYLKNLETNHTVEIPGTVHSNDTLALSEGILCYEAGTENGLDIFCSNGLHLERPGDQRNPSLWKQWLLFHEGQHALLYGPIK